MSRFWIYYESRIAGFAEAMDEIHQREASRRTPGVLFEQMDEHILKVPKLGGLEKKWIWEIRAVLYFGTFIFEILKRLPRRTVE